MSIIKLLLGRLHPLLIHLPIGFILLGLILLFKDRKEKKYTHLISQIFLWAGLASILSCVTGYCQYLAEGYSFQTISWHLWMAIITTLLCFILYKRLAQTTHDEKGAKKQPSIYAMTLFLITSLTGHFGGDITHGKNYLIEPLLSKSEGTNGQKGLSLEEENLETTLFFEQAIQPIFDHRCVSCHNPKKKKGGLSLENYDDLISGGENGSILSTDQTEFALLYECLISPVEEEGHMPPEGKLQPKKEEIELIKTWIELGTPTNRTIGQLSIDHSLFHSFFHKEEQSLYPEVDISKASDDSIALVKNEGIHIQHVAQNKNFLRVSCLNKADFEDEDINLLSPLYEHIVELDLGGTKITNEIVTDLLFMPNLTVLNMDHSAINSEGISQLSKLAHLKHLNLSYSSFDVSEIQIFDDFPSLLSVNLYGVDSSQKGSIILDNDRTVIELGNFDLPPIASDSIVF